MFKRLFIILILPLAFLLLTGASDRGIKLVIKDKTGEQVGLYEASYALVIGVSDYTAGWPDLPGVKDDLKAVEMSLKEHGFKVILVKDAARKEMTDAIDNFISTYGRNFDNRLLVYYSGHGYTIRQKWGGEMGYIVPADAPNPNVDADGFMDKAIDMQQIEVYAKRIQSKHVLYIFDSCFSGSIFALSKAVPAAISYKTSKPVRQFITAGGSDEEVPDKSIFRQQLVAALSGEGDVNGDGYVTGSELGEFLQNKVINYSYESQHPQYGKIRNPNLDKGDFVFQLPKSMERYTGSELPEAPGKSSFSIEDLKKGAKQEEAVKTEWRKWQ